MGRLFMDPLDDPFAAADRELEACPLGQVADAVVVDIHAEATSEKQALAHHLDGRATLVVGTHTHVPISDHRVLAGGTAFMSDAGMCGDYNSVLGMQKENRSAAFSRRRPARAWTRIRRGHPVRDRGNATFRSRCYRRSNPSRRSRTFRFVSAEEMS